jgi:outer membrane protein assembly factor BamB
MLSRLRLPAIAGLNLLLLGGLVLLSPGRIETRPGPGAVADASGSERDTARLHLHWVRDLPALEPTWPDQPRFTTDTARRPVPAGGLVLLSCSHTDSVLALDSASGAVRWRFRCDGPVRFAPAVREGRVYAASDDGYLYCLELSRGKLLWKFRGAPAERCILGNERLISTWPARGGPVVAGDGKGGTVYFAAGIWPFMGVFLYALDARSGAVRWQNTGDGSRFIKQPHQADAFAGVGPQGSLVVDGDRLFVPGGRSLPACYDRHTGKLLHYRLADNSKRGGGPDVVAGSGLYINGDGAFDQDRGDYLGPVGAPVALAGSRLYRARGQLVELFDLEARSRPKGRASKTRRFPSQAWLGKSKGQARVPATTTLLAADDRLYGAGPGRVYALALPLSSGQGKPAWEAKIEGTPLHLAADGRRLFASTREGQLYAFAPGEVKPRRHRQEVVPLPGADKAQVQMANRVLEVSGVRAGYAVLWGGTAGLAGELLRRSDLRLVIVEPNAQRIEDLRRRFQEAGVFGRRLCVLPSPARLPPYLCSLMASEDLAGFEVDSTFFSAVFQSLRPHGGAACLPLTDQQRAALARWARGEPLARIEQVKGLTVLSRPGALPGSGNWTHEHADAANTRVSLDERVKAPLGLLWFGGPSHQGILPRHGHGPVPQAVDGRLIIEGPDRLRAVDFYTGRLLWESTLPGVGKVYDNLAHQPGANATGSNYVSTPEGIFVAYGREGLRLDPATGRIVQRYRLPPPRRTFSRDAKRSAANTAPEWSFISVAGRYLIAGAGPTGEPSRTARRSGSARRTYRGRESSPLLSVLDRDTGKLLWQAEARQAWRHNAICAGNGRLYAIDRAPWDLAAKFSRNKKRSEEVLSRLVAFDLATGKVQWQSEDEVFGTWLSYSTAHDVLIEAGLMTRDTLADEAPGMRAWRGGGRAGLRQRPEVLWHRREYFGPALIHGDRILKSGAGGAGSGTACDLRTGQPIQVPDPITGQPREWKWLRTYGCNTPAACRNLVLFRSGAAGFYDLACDGGTGNLGGFRSSCTMNLIAAGGVLTVPDYTRTCTCSYQQQASLALIHMPAAELWTFTSARKIDGIVRRVGLNLGAPGSRKADNGTLWVEYPPVGGPSPRLAITTRPAKLDTFRWHSSLVKGDTLPWVAGSGVRGLRELKVRLGPDRSPPRRYTVRLVFLEPDELPAGRRLFDVSLQGEKKVHRLDVSAEAMGPGRPLVREFTGVMVQRDLVISLVPVTGAPVLSGVEVLAEGW